MQLSELFNLVEGAQVSHDVAITSLEYDSRKVMPGSLFFAIEGEQFDGHDFIPDAVARGACAVIAQKKVDLEIPYAVVKDTRIAMSKLARRFYGSFDSIATFGITGTNGKTTTAFLLHEVMKKAGMNPALVGTIWYIISGVREPAERTTPESLDIFKLLHRAEQSKARAIVMEVSSHALSLHRVDDVSFHVAIFTNLSQDHLDFHGTISAYKEAKLRLFTLLKDNGVAVVNQDDPVSADIVRLPIPKVVTYGLTHPADYTATVVKDTIDGITIEIKWRGNKQRISSPLVGSFNAYNLVAAFAAARAHGIAASIIRQGIAGVDRVPGRMERITGNVFVDYAHTPDAMRNALTALRRYCSGRLLVVFGCGGDRDRSKRPIMGKIASEYADCVIITSDNPRSENPYRVIDDIKQGVTGDNVTAIEDRAEAIAEVLNMMQTDDIVLVAGKGHENYQIIGNKRIAFDDAEIIKQCSGK